MKIKFAVVGCGHIGKRHIEMIRRNPDCELVAVCDILFNDELADELTSKQVNEDANQRFNDSTVQRFNDLEAMLLNADFDVLNICTPNGLHASMAVKGLDSGHHVVIEKPMALSTLEAQSVLDASDKNGKRVFCVMQNRYSPPSVWLKELVSSGKLGNIYMVQVNCYWNRDERYYKPGNWHGTQDMDGGTLFTQFSHFIDLMYWLFGEISDIQANLADFNHQHLTDFEDSGFVSFRFRNGGMGMFNYSTAVYNKNFESSVTVIAENGTVKVGGQYMNEVEYCHIKDYEMPILAPTNPGNDYGAYTGSAQNHHYVIENIVDVLNRGRHVTTNAYEGYKVVEIIEKIYGKSRRVNK